MSHQAPESFRRLITKRRFITSIFILLFIVPVYGADKAKDEETLRNAATVLQGMIEGNGVPQDALSRADCVIVLPNVKKFGLGIGGSCGRVPMASPAAQNFR